MATSRHRLPARRLITAPLLILIAAGLTLQSIAALARYAHNADLRDLAASIEKGFKPDAEYLSRFVADSGLDHPSGDCNDALTRARLTIGLAVLESASKRDDLVQIDAAKSNALQIAKERLVCNPLDGNAWLRFATIAVQTNGPAPMAIDALRLSYWSAPNESWIVDARLPFATQLYLAGVSGFETEYLDDLRRFATYEPGKQVAATFVATAPRIRALLRPLINLQPQERKKNIVAEIDRLGLLFDAQ